MNRRSFLGNLIGGVAATAAVQTWPFRVYSFPTEIVAPEVLTIGDFMEMYTKPAIAELTRQMDASFTEFFYQSAIPIGSTLNVRRPQQFSSIST